MDDCIFCKIISGVIPSEKVFEDEHSFAFLDIRPINLGHTLVIPKTHAKDIYTISAHDFGAIMETVRKLAPIIKEAVNADGVNIGMNNEGAAGQVVFHAHVHIIPRHSEDGFKHWHGEDISPNAIAATGNAIRNIVSRS